MGEIQNVIYLPDSIYCSCTPCKCSYICKSESAKDDARRKNNPIDPDNDGSLDYALKKNLRY